MPDKKKFDETNRGVLFVNNRRTKQSQPDKTGKLLIKADDFAPDADGNVLIYISAWVKDNAQHGEIIQMVANPPQDK